MIRVSLTGALILSILVACSVTHIDRFIEFRIIGIVIDTTDGTTVAGTQIEFVDTGFDDVRSQTYRPQKIGDSDANGRFELNFWFLWGRDERWYTPKANETFDILLSKNGYRTKLLKMRADNFERKGNEITVNLGSITILRD